VSKAVGYDNFQRSKVNREGHSVGNRIACRSMTVHFGGRGARTLIGAIARLVDTKTMKISQFYPGAPGSLIGLDKLLK
jgi:hypothetical protein